LGSDAFCILWDGKALHGLNASGRAPQAWTPEYFQKKYGPDAMQPPKRGIDSVTVPGAVASWVAMSERFGKLPFADLMQSAIEIAERGYLLSRAGGGVAQPTRIHRAFFAQRPCATSG
jgi:gamma-glutamyltranspeptidase/glutathione hydrolase